VGFLLAFTRGYIARIREHSCSASPGSTTPPTYVLFDSISPESKRDVNHTEVMKP
jgi:hypothetical protein